MFLTTIRLRGKPIKRQEIILTLQELSDRMKSDEGCVKADLYQDINDADTLYLLEEWQTRDSLSKHKESEFAAVIRGMAPLLVESVEIKQAGTIQNEN